MNLVALRKTVMVSLTVGFVLSLLFWLAVLVNDEVSQSRSAFYIPPLLRLLEPGLGTAARWFPCTSDPEPQRGCEPYKRVPAILFVNGIAYAGVLLLPIYIIRKWTSTLD
jgi:peptidoglycan/LPS O-acetylase OafA/YrhL